MAKVLVLRPWKLARTQINNKNVSASQLECQQAEWTCVLFALLTPIKWARRDNSDGVAPKRHGGIQVRLNTNAHTQQHMHGNKAQTTDNSNNTNVKTNKTARQPRKQWATRTLQCAHCNDIELAATITRTCSGNSINGM